MTWARSLGQEDPLEEETATHSSVLAWGIPWTEDLVGFSPWGHRVGHKQRFFDLLHMKYHHQAPLPSAQRSLVHKPAQHWRTMQVEEVAGLVFPWAKD